MALNEPMRGAKAVKMLSYFAVANSGEYPRLQYPSRPVSFLVSLSPGEQPGATPHEPASPILIDFGLATSNRDGGFAFLFRLDSRFAFHCLPRIALNLPNGPLYYALMSDASVSRFDLVSEISMSSFRVFHDSSTSKVMGVLRCDLSFREFV